MKMSLQKFQPLCCLMSLRNSYASSMIWHNFIGFFCDPSMNFTEELYPEVYKLLSSFRPGAQKSHPQLEHTPCRKILLRGMHITAGLTPDLLAQDKCNCATAVKQCHKNLNLTKPMSIFYYQMQYQVNILFRLNYNMQYFVGGG